MIFLCICTLTALPLPGIEADAPNIILLMSDDQRLGDVGFNGTDSLQTPNLGSIATAGVRFDR